MKTNHIKETLRRLHEDLDARNVVDPKLRELLKTLESDIHEVLDQRPGRDETATENIVDRLEALEADFATEHPTIERFARELIDALGKMGI